jgi:chemotaxis response regulator CheB
MVTAVSEGRISLLNANRENSTTTPVRILLVDDFEQFRILVSSILKDQPGYQIVGEAIDGLDAIKIAGELKPDLVALDIGLPD